MALAMQLVWIQFVGFCSLSLSVNSQSSLLVLVQAAFGV
jgi:hypothetical protein